MGTVAKIQLSNSTSATTADTFGSWTNVNSQTVSTTEILLDFSDGTDTGWDITITDEASGSSDTQGVNAVGTGDADWVDEATVSASYHFVSSTNIATYELSNLNNSNTYTIKAFGSRQATGPREGEFTVDGFSTVQTLDAAMNSTEIVLFENVSPSGGIINLELRLAGGSSFCYAGAIGVEEFEAGGVTIPVFMNSYRQRRV